MTETIKSLVRHILTAIGVVLGFIGLDKYTGLLEYVIQNLDTVWAAVLSLIGFVTAIVGFFTNKERFNR